jgi:predicted nuclease of predicted toxin-antitoxin system
LQICQQRGRIIISKDEDFFHWSRRPKAGITLIWVRLGNCRTASLLAAFDALWPRIEERLNAGDAVIEVR